MKNKKHLPFVLILILLISYFIFICSVFAHSGRTDANGGHWNHSTGEYHYHTGEYAGRTQSSSYRENDMSKKINISKEEFENLKPTGNGNYSGKKIYISKEEFENLKPTGNGKYYEAETENKSNVSKVKISNTSGSKVYKMSNAEFEKRLQKQREEAEKAKKAEAPKVTKSSTDKEPLPDESTKKSKMLLFVIPFLAVACFYLLYIKILRKRSEYSMPLKEVNDTRADDFSGKAHKTDSVHPRKLKDTFCFAVAVIVLFVSMCSALQYLAVHHEKGIAVAYFLLWLWAFDYAFQKDSKSKKISELECENEMLKNILENYKKSDEQLQIKISEKEKILPLNPCAIPDDVVFDDRNLPVRTSRSRKKKVNYGKDFNAFLVKGGTLYHKKSCKKLKGKKITTKHIYECIADKNKKPCPICNPRTKTHEWYNAKFPDSSYAKASNYDKEEQLSLFDDVDA